MRTKTLIQGFKNSQKIRVMIDGFGIYTTVGGVGAVFATHSHRQAAFDGLFRLSSDRYYAQRKGDPLPTMVSMTTMNTSQVSKQVQVDLLGS
jgi:hypothetical protein